MSEYCPPNCEGQVMLACMEAEATAEGAVCRVTGVEPNSILGIVTRERCGGVVVASAVVQGESGPTSLPSPVIAEVGMSLRASQTAVSALRHRVAACPGSAATGCPMVQTQEAENITRDVA